MVRQLYAVKLIIHTFHFAREAKTVTAFNCFRKIISGGCCHNVSVAHAGCSVSNSNPLSTTKETVVSNTKYRVESASTLSPGFRGARLLEWSAMWIRRH